MNKEEIERIALEVCDPLDARKIGTYGVCEFAHRFLARIDAERGKDAVAWASREHEDLSWNHSSYFTLPLFLSPTPTIPEKLSLCLEPALISAEHAKWEAATILADDDPSYDTFCGGWKAALKLIAAQGDRNAD